MRFRQRLAWFLLLLYLSCTFICLYYIFQIDEHFSRYALEHNEIHSNGRIENLREFAKAAHIWGATEDPSVAESGSSAPGNVWRTLQHVYDIPTFLLSFLFIIIYLQVFCMLWMCTRSEMPSLCVFLWPVYIYHTTRAKSYGVGAK